MRAIKKNTYPLEKCYAINTINLRGTKHVVVAAEKEDDCILFDLDGNFEETIWKGPSGTMSIVPLDDKKDGMFLASRKFFSPNDSMDAHIVTMTPKAEGGWNEHLLCKAQCVHRFGVLKSNGKEYLLGASIKEKHEYRDDWRFLGEMLACELPSHPDVETCELKPVVSGLLKNHGFTLRTQANGDQYAVIACDSGVYEIHPPVEGSTEWMKVLLTEDATSDITFADFDGDGVDEMLALAPFHGDFVRVYKKNSQGTYDKVWESPEKHEFSHSIWAGTLQGKTFAITGHRKGASRDLNALVYRDGSYALELLDKDCGSTNVAVYKNGDKDYLISTNREINQVAFYELEV